MASSLEAAGDAVVGYFLADDTMFMGAWSAADGSLLWESPAGLSHTARGVRLTPTVTDSGEVVFLSPEDASGWSTMKIVDAESGETLVHSRPVWASSRPALCEETPCVTGFSRADGDRGVLVTAASGIPLLVFAAVILGVAVGLQRRVTGGVLAPIITHLIWSLGMLFLLPPLFAWAS